MVATVNSLVGIVCLFFKNLDSNGFIYPTKRAPARWGLQPRGNGRRPGLRGLYARCFLCRGRGVAVYTPLIERWRGRNAACIQRKGWGPGKNMQVINNSQNGSSTCLQSNHSDYIIIIISSSSSSICFLGLHPRHMEVPRLGVESELWLPAYATAIARPDPELSCVCDLHHSSWLTLDP